MRSSWILRRTSTTSSPAPAPAPAASLAIATAVLRRAPQRDPAQRAAAEGVAVGNILAHPGGKNVVALALINSRVPAKPHEHKIADCHGAAIYLDCRIYGVRSLSGNERMINVTVGRHAQLLFNPRVREECPGRVSQRWPDGGYLGDEDIIRRMVVRAAGNLQRFCHYVDHDGVVKSNSYG